MPEQGLESAILTGVDAPIYAIAIDAYSGVIALGMGPEVHLAKRVAPSKYHPHRLEQLLTVVYTDHYATFKIFPPPPELPSTMQDIEKRIRVRALAFKEGGRHLIATYLSHGIVSVYLILSKVSTTYRNLEVAGILCIPTPSYYGHLCLCTPIS